MNGKLLVLVALVGSFFCVATFSHIVDGPIALTEAPHHEPLAGVRKGLDIKFVTELSPYMRSER